MNQIYKIGDFLKRVKRQIQIENEQFYKRVTIKTNHKGIYLRDEIIGSLIGTKNQFIVKNGDFLLSKIDAMNGAFGVVPAEIDNAIITGNFWAYKVNKSIVNEQWFLEYTSSDLFLKICQDCSTGTTHRKYLDEKVFLNHIVSIPPIQNQDKLVNDIAKNKNYVSNLQTEINTQSQLLKLLRQTILQEAIQGKLTQEWRLQNPDVIPASVLLQQIKKEKEQLIKDKKIKKEKPLPPINDTEIPFELPENWTWCRLGEIITINPSNSNKDDLECSFIPMTHIKREFGISPTFEKRIWKEIKKGFTHFQNDDVIVAKITPCFENSKAGILKNLINDFGAGTTELYILRCIHKYFENMFVYIFIKSTYFLKGGESVMTGTAGQKRVPREFIAEILFPLPPLSEQKIIVEKVEALMKKCDILEEEITSLETYSKELLKALFHETFTQA